MNAKSNTERQRDFDKAKRDAGYTKWSRWIHKDDVAHFERLHKEREDERQAKEAAKAEA